MLTATQARQMIKNLQDGGVSQALNRIEECILSRINEGQYFVHISMNTLGVQFDKICHLIKSLEKSGYCVRTQGCWSNHSGTEDMLCISWDFDKNAQTA